MKTLVYGIDCSPWQAIRTLHQIAEDHAPNACVNRIIKENFYMNDCFFGAGFVEECKKLISEITSTSTDLSKIDDTMKKLDLLYNSTHDEFSFKIRDISKITYTKRGLLSITASVYDPIGWLLPVIMKLRMLLQTLWLQKKDWDDVTDEQTKYAFESCIRMLPML